MGRADGDEPRPDPLPRRGDAGRPRRAVRRASGRRSTSSPRARPGGRDPGLVRGLDGQAVPGHRHGEPGRRALLQLHDPEPTGVVAIIAPEEAPLAGLVRRLAPALCGGNVVVSLAAESSPLAALTLAEVLATSDIPAGVVNIISGQRKELLGWLASHMDVN